MYTHNDILDYIILEVEGCFEYINFKPIKISAAICTNLTSEHSSLIKLNHSGLWCSQKKFKLKHLAIKGEI